METTPKPNDKLTTAQVAELNNVKPATWRAHVARGLRPAPDGHSDPCGCPWWYRKTITKDLNTRAAKAQERADRMAAVASSV